MIQFILKNILLPALFLLMPLIAVSQVIQDWVSRYNGSGNSFDIVSELIIDKQNNVNVYGSSIGVNTLSDFTIVKYRSNGEVIWTALYDVSGSIDQINSADMDDEGNSYVTGMTTDSNLISAITTAMIDSSGKILWVKKFHSSGFIYGSGQSISVDNSGNVAVTGFIRNLFGYFDIILIKYSLAGAELASEIYSGISPGNSLPVSIKTDSFDNVFIVGTSKTNSGSEDIILLKYDSAFNLIGENIFNGTANLDDKVSDIVTDEENNVYICGSIYNNFSHSDFFVAKINSLGIHVWSRIIDGAGHNLDFANSITIDNAHIYVTGSSRNDTILGSEDFMTVKLNMDGTVVWTSVYNGNSGGSDYGNSIDIDIEGNVYAGGASDRGNNQMEYTLLKYNSFGVLEWLKKYSIAEIPEDFIYSLKIDTSGSIVVSGISIGINTDYDFATIKYSQLTNICGNSHENPASFYLEQNFPNPFNPQTIIRFNLPEYEHVSLIVYDVLGNQVDVLVDEPLSSGNHEIEFDGSSFSSGVYFYKLETPYSQEVKRMVLLK